MNPHRLASLALLTASLAAPVNAQVASPPQVIGTIAGPGSTPVNPNLGFFGTDLGWTVEHDGELRILFGDTDEAFNSKCFPMLFNDDSQGRIPLKRPEGVPPLTMDTKPGEPNVLQRIIVTRKGESLQMGYGQVPVSAYSDGQSLVGIVDRFNGELYQTARFRGHGGLTQLQRIHFTQTLEAHHRRLGP